MSNLDTEKMPAISDPASSETSANMVDVEKDTDPGEQQAPSTERPIHGIKWALAVAAILSSTFLFALDTTIVADVQPNIVQTFGEIDKLPWLAVAFVLPSASLVFPWSKAYSIFNVKWLYIAHVLLFEVGSAVAGGAPNMNALIVGRAIAGIGGCGMYIGGLTYFSVMTTPKERPIYVSLVTPVWGLGTVLGPVIGGAFAVSSATWRWGFYINLVIAALFAPVILFVLPSVDLQPSLAVKDRLKQIDWLGLLIYIGWSISFTCAIDFGGSLYAWNSASEIVLWVMSGVLMIIFMLTQKFHPFVEAKHKLYPTHLMRNWKLVILQFQTFAATAVVYVPIYYIPLFFQFTHGDSALEAGVRLLPFVFMIVFFSLLNGFTMSKLGYYMPWYVWAAATSLVGTTLMYTVKSTTSNSAIYGYSVLIGVGGGCFLLSSFGVAPALVSSVEEIFDAIAFLSAAQGLGLVFFLSTAGNIFQNLGVNYVTPLVPSNLASNVRPLIAGTSSALFDQLPANTREQVLAAIIQAMDKVYLLGLGASAIALVLAPFLGTGKI